MIKIRHLLIFPLILSLSFFLAATVSAHKKVVVIPLMSDSDKEIPKVTSAGGRVWMITKLMAGCINGVGLTMGIKFAVPQPKHSAPEMFQNIAILSR